MKILKLVLLVLVLTLVLFFLFKNTIVKAMIEKGAHIATGLPLEIEKLELSFLKTTVDIQGLRLYNPKSFEEKLMLDLSKVYFAFDLPAFLKGDLHIPAIRIYLDEFNVVKNKDGALNLDALKPAQKAETKQPVPVEKKPPQEMAPMKIDIFELKIGKVYYKDYTRGGDKPFVQTFNIGIHEQFKNVEDINSLVRIIVVKALAGTTISQLTNFDVSGLANSVSGVLSTSTQAMSAEAMKAWGSAIDSTGKTLSDAQKLMEDPSKLAANAKTAATDILKGTTGEAANLTGEAKQAATALSDKTKDVAAELKEKIKFPFGNQTE